MAADLRLATRYEDNSAEIEQRYYKEMVTALAGVGTLVNDFHVQAPQNEKSHIAAALSR